MGSTINYNQIESDSQYFPIIVVKEFFITRTMNFLLGLNKILFMFELEDQKPNFGYKNNYNVVISLSALDFNNKKDKIDIITEKLIF